MSRLPGRLRLFGAAALSCAVSAPFALASPALAATSVSSFEAETMSLSTSLGRINADSSASAGKNLTIWANGAALKSVTTSQPADRLVVRARGSQCSGAPKVQVKVDGVQVLLASVASTYNEFGAAVKVPAGAHKITAGLVNDYRTSSCDRNLMVDKVALTSAATTAPVIDPPVQEPTQPPAPTSAPSISNLTASVADGVATIAYAKAGGAISSLTWRTTGTGAHTGTVAQPDVASFTAALPAGSYTMYVRAANAVGDDEDPVTITVPAAPGTPTQEPTDPVTAPTGRLIWNGDFSTGNFSQYAKVQVASTDSATIMDDPILGSARKALKLTVHNYSQDPTSSTSPKHRAQAESPSVIGLSDDVYIGFSLLLPKTFPTIHNRGLVSPTTSSMQAALHSIYGAPFGGSSTQQLGITRSEPDQAIRLLRNSSYNYDNPWSMQAERGTSEDIAGRWIDFVIHTKMSSNGSIGFREQWVNTGSGFVKSTFANGTTKLMMRTVDSSNNSGPNYSKVQLYYNDNAFVTPDNPNGTATVYYADHKIGTSFDVVAPRSYR